jgi:Restriction endonuclease BamHI
MGYTPRAMKIAKEITLFSVGAFSESAEWRKIRKSVRGTVCGVEHPAGSGSFTIHSESGKKRGEGNGVVPIKLGMMQALQAQGWTLEGKASNALGHRLGEFDAVLETSARPVVVEWETGNVSSSHRSLNKMAMLLSDGILSAGILVVPTKRLAQYLTDRIGNYEELSGFWNFWARYPCRDGVLEVFGIEQDAEGTHVARIPKGTDGRAMF